MNQKEISRKELERYEQLYHLDHSIADLTPTLCALCGVRPPDVCGGSPIAPVVDQADKLMDGIGRTEKVLVFCPDACGEAQRARRPDLFERVKKLAGFQVPSSSVMPSVTPVCYASIFSGASPEVHGIRTYEKPVLPVETLFDVFAESGRSVAICAVNECSIDLIFRRRKIDYFSLRTDEAVFRLSLDLIRRQEYDLIVSYMTGYDHSAHHTGVFSPESMGQLELMADRFEALCAETESAWKPFHRCVAFVPDHGQHAVDDDHGGHGENIPEDMVVNHYYRIRDGKR